ADTAPRTDLITDSERFYSSIMELLDDPDESDEVDQLITWWNRFGHNSQQQDLC
ncbi:hypothetical protein EDD15DRAFT_2154631, partial [Pisolithus albus]